MLRRVGRRGLWTLSALLLAAGLATSCLELRAPAGPPQPPAWAATTRPVDHRSVALTPSPPVQVAIPSIGVRAPLTRLGLEPDGSVQVPAADRAFEAGWYDGGPTPGERGPAVILGHVDTAKGAAVFYDLGRLRPGDRVEVNRADGRVAVFTVESVERVAKDRFPTRRVYGPIGHAGLRMVTCGGSFDRTKRSYQDNIIVYAAQTSVS